jgi:hypothetical protein
MKWERMIMLVLGIFVLCSFFPFSVISLHKHRLPKKRREYQRLRKILNKGRAAHHPG